MEGVPDCYTTSVMVLREGDPGDVEPPTQLEAVDFPAPPEPLEAFFTAGGIATLPYRYRGELRTMEYKTLRCPGHAEIMKSIRDLRLLSLDPVQEGGRNHPPPKGSPHQNRGRWRTGTACLWPLESPGWGTG
jgi:lysine 6-dehydrogenase